MELWYTEEHTPDVRFSIRVDKHIYSEQTKFQRIDFSIPRSSAGS